MRTVDEIYQEMLADFEERIGMDLSNSCDLAVRLYTVAAQVSALSVQTDWVKKQCFPQTAEGEYLDYHAQMRALTRQEAVHAVGTIRFSVRAAAEEDLTVPQGTVCISSAGMHYETTEEAVLTAGMLYVDALAQAVEAGAAGNTGANTILSMSVAPSGIVSCTNPEAFTGGEEQEDDESLRKRILESYQRLPNGANAAFYDSQARLYPGVVAAKAVGRARGVGTVDIYVATTVGSPEEALLSEIQADLEEKREIAVDLQVLAPTEKSVDVSVALSVSSETDFETVQAAAQDRIRDYFTGALLGKAVQLADLYALLHNVEGLSNYHILAPTEDVAAETTVLPVLGTLSISAL